MNVVLLPYQKQMPQALVYALLHGMKYDAHSDLFVHFFRLRLQLILGAGGIGDVCT